MRTTILLTLALGCGEKETDSATSDTDSGDTTPDTTDDTAACCDSGSTVPDGPVHSLSWSLHPDHGSLVYASWEQDFAGEAVVEFSFDDGVWKSTPSQTAAAGAHQQLIIGIPYGHTAEWRVVVSDGSTEEVTSGQPITTGGLDADFPIPMVEASDETKWLSTGNYLLTSINEDDGGWTQGTYWTFIMDRQGRVVWANETPHNHWTLFAQVAVAGDHILWDEATYWADFDRGQGSTVHRAYLDAEIEEIATPGLHHAFIQLPDETLAWGSQHHADSEALVQMSLTDRKIDVMWNCEDDWPGVDNCESNGLFYQESTDSFLYSFYTNDSIVEVSRKTGETMWWAGRVEEGYTFDPEKHQYDWQHGISYTEAGTLLVSTLSTVSGSTTTMLREYTVDHKAQTLTSVWEYDPEVHAGTNGDAWRLSNGNTLHVIGSAGHVVEVTTDGEEVWHVNFNDNFLMGRGQFIEDLYTLVSPTR